MMWSVHFASRHSLALSLPSASIIVLAKPIFSSIMAESKIFFDLPLKEKLAGQKQIKALEVLRNQKRRSLFDAQDEIDNQREQLIAQIEGKIEQKTELRLLFTIRWKLR